jgi:hypothetical protein
VPDVSSSRNRQSHQFLRRLVLTLLLVSIDSHELGAQSRKVQEAIDVIVMLCVAGGAKREISRDKDVRIESTSEAKGLVDGLTKEVSKLAAEQASEARTCMRPYIERVLSMLEDRSSPPVGIDEPRVPRGTSEGPYGPRGFGPQGFGPHGFPRPLRGQPRGTSETPYPRPPTDSAVYDLWESLDKFAPPRR